MQNVLSKTFDNKMHFTETLLLKISAFVFPWIILLAIPKWQFGYWGQVEGQITFVHLLCSVLTINIFIVLYRHKNLRKILWEPLVVIPFFIGLISLLSGIFQRVPVLALFGSPQIGQGAFWYFDFCILTIIYALVWSTRPMRIALSVNLFFVILVTTVFTLKPDLANHKITFFFFYDYLVFYGLAFIIVCYSLFKQEGLVFKINYRYYAVVFYAVLLPYFWILENESACLLWLLTGLLWAFILFLNNISSKSKYIKILLNNIYSPKFFVFIVILASATILLSSFAFWDGESFLLNKKWGELNILEKIQTRYLGSLIARGSIIRVLLEHLSSIGAIFIGYGWGSTSDLLISSFNKEVFDQINTGNRVHFHTHNEMFEHMISAGIFCLIAYILYMYYVFKKAFLRAGIVPYLLLIYLLLCCFWFQFISTLPLMAFAIATLIDFPKFKEKINISSKKTYRDHPFLLTSYLAIIFCLSLYGGVLGVLTIRSNAEFKTPEKLMNLTQEFSYGNCLSEAGNDYGRGGLHLADRLNGYTNYIDNQIKSNQISKSDMVAMGWFLCATDDLIETERSSIELINAYINTVSFISTIKSDSTRNQLKNLTNNYLETWDRRIRSLLILAPKRYDQITPYVSFLLNENKLNRMQEICNYSRKFEKDLPYCDLAEAVIYIDKNEFEKAALLIDKAQKNGLFSPKIGEKPLDEEFVKKLKNFVNRHKK